MLAEIEARLEAEVAALKLVDGAAAFMALRTNPPKSKQPAAYVFPVADKAGPNALAMAVDQEVTERYAVALALGNFKDRRGETATQQMETIRDSVRDALLGWVPEAGKEGCLYAGGRVLDMRDGVVWWQLEFTATYHIRAT